MYLLSAADGLRYFAAAAAAAAAALLLLSWAT
jgi:hypothetical protein